MKYAEQPYALGNVDSWYQSQPASMMVRSTSDHQVTCLLKAGVEACSRNSYDTDSQLWAWAGKHRDASERRGPSLIRSVRVATVGLLRQYTGRNESMMVNAQAVAPMVLGVAPLQWKVQ